MNRDIIEGNWKQLKGKLKEQWGKLTDDDLDIIEGKYRQRLYKFDQKGALLTGQAEEVFPQLGSLDQGVIPFTFIGATNNDHTIDDAPLLPLAELNIGHFRNSADNEESSFVVGQPTLFIAPGESMSLQVFQELGNQVFHILSVGKHKNN